ncbi:hypothetical protein ACFX12_000365 [Malus domestica]
MNPSSMHLNTVELLTGVNYKKWKQDLENVLGVMEWDLALRTEKPPTPTDGSTLSQKSKHEKKYQESLKTETYATNATNFLKSIEETYQELPKIETGILMNSLTTMRHDGIESVSEYILKMVDLIGKLYSLEIHGRIYVVPRPPVLCINIWRRLWEITRKAMSMFFDATMFDFDYEQSKLWYPPVRPASQFDELLVDDEEFLLEGGLHTKFPDLTFTRSTHPPPSTTVSTTRKRFSNPGSDSKIQFQLHHAFGDSNFLPVGTFSARLKTWNHGGKKFKLKTDYKSICGEHNTNCT